MIRYLVIAFLTLVLSCAATTSVPACALPVRASVALRVDGTETEFQWTAEAVSRWAPHTLPDHTPTVDPNGQWLITFCPNDDARFAPGVGGLTSVSARRIWIKRGYPDETMRFVILHEVGHAMGLDHVSDPKAVMSKTGAPEFTEADIEECRRAGACGSITVRAEEHQ